MRKFIVWILTGFFTCQGKPGIPGKIREFKNPFSSLQAHINHRHLKPSSGSPAPGHPVVAPTAPPSAAHVPLARDPRAHALQVDVSHQTILAGHMPTPEAHDHSRGSAAVPMGSPAGQSRQQYPHSPANYSGTIPVSSARPNLITVPIQDDGGPAHMHSMPAYASPGTAPLPPPIQHPGTAYTYQQQHATPYSQAPPITTPAFSQPPPPVHHQPQMHQPGSAAGGAIYSTPPPPVHHQPPSTYTPPRNPMHPPPPQQRFHEEGAGSYMPPQWGGPPRGTVPPPPARASLPPRPLPAPSASNPITGQLQPRGGPADAGYRQPYYQ